MADEFDYVVIAGASTSCAVAVQPSENLSVSAYLLGAGGYGDNALTRPPVGTALMAI